MKFLGNWSGGKASRFDYGTPKRNLRKSTLDGAALKRRVLSDGIVYLKQGVGVAYSKSIPMRGKLINLGLKECLV